MNVINNIEKLFNKYRSSSFLLNKKQIKIASITQENRKITIRKNDVVLDLKERIHLSDKKYKTSIEFPTETEEEFTLDFSQDGDKILKNIEDKVQFKPQKIYIRLNRNDEGDREKLIKICKSLSKNHGMEIDFIDKNTSLDVDSTRKRNNKYFTVVAKPFHPVFKWYQKKLNFINFYEGKIVNADKVKVNFEGNSPDFYLYGEFAKLKEIKVSDCKICSLFIFSANGWQDNINIKVNTNCLVKLFFFDKIWKRYKIGGA